MSHSHYQPCYTRPYLNKEQGQIPQPPWWQQYQPARPWYGRRPSGWAWPCSGYLRQSKRLLFRIYEILLTQGLGMLIITVKRAFQGNPSWEILITSSTPPWHEGSVGVNLYHASSSRWLNRGKFLCLYYQVLHIICFLGCEWLCASSCQPGKESWQAKEDLAQPRLRLVYVQTSSRK